MVMAHISRSRIEFRPLPVLSLFLLLLSSPVFAITDSDCMSCHKGEVFREATDGKRERIPPVRRELKGSVHREMACTDCHRDVTVLPHQKDRAKVDCSACHKRPAGLFARSVHGTALRQGDKDALSCTSCHGSHQIYRVSDSRSPVFRGNQVLLCSGCHTDVGMQKTHKLPSPELVKAYEKSVHRRVVKEGEAIRAAVCSDCHSTHLILGPKERESRINRANIPTVCGRCHVHIYNEYRVSIHGQALEQGKVESPGCTDCHGGHTLPMVKDPKAQVYARNIPTTCARCHENQQIIKKYGLPPDRYSSYAGSFHGVAMKQGNITAANCTSCHEVHRILPAAYAESSVSPQNLSKTCGKCHTGMKETVYLGKIHVKAEEESSPAMYYVRWFRSWLMITQRTPITD
jgi:hypothetical protein